MSRLLCCVLLLFGWSVRLAWADEAMLTPDQVAVRLRLGLQPSRDDGRLVFADDRRRVVLNPGMDRAVVNGSAVELPALVAYEDGQPRIPESCIAVIQSKMDLTLNTVSTTVNRPAQPRTTPKPRGPNPRFDVVMLDAGHGGKDSGAPNPGMKLYEKDIVLEITMEMKRILEANGIQVLLTRKDDTFIELIQRSVLANEAQPDCFVSIHANASKSSQANGFEVFYDTQQWTNADKADAAAHRTEPDLGKWGGRGGLAVEETTEEMLYRMVIEDNLRQSKQLAFAVNRAMIRDIQDENRGVKRANLSVLRETFVPSILVEVGFVTHAPTAKKLADSAYRRRLAKTLCDGLLEYRKAYDTAAGAAPRQ